MVAPGDFVESKLLMPYKTHQIENVIPSEKLLSSFTVFKQVILCGKSLRDFHSLQEYPSSLIQSWFVTKCIKFSYKRNRCNSNISIAQLAVLFWSGSNFQRRLRNRVSGFFFGKKNTRYQHNRTRVPNIWSPSKHLNVQTIEKTNELPLETFIVADWCGTSDNRSCYRSHGTQIAVRYPTDQSTSLNF